jgi:glycine hydroxymethyltransferase
MISLLKNLIAKEEKRQLSQWNLIASENVAYDEVNAICGSSLSNKYVEGAVGRRFYRGCSIIDEIEKFAVSQAESLFSAEYANVAPHCGAMANVIAYMALLQKGDRVLAMDFSSGGHISHGHKMNISSQLYDFSFYGVTKKTGRIDYDAVEKKIKEVRPRLLISGASAYSRLIDYEKMGALAKKYGALHMVDMAHIAGLVAAQVLPSPIPYADVVTLTTHKTLRGPRGGMILAKKQYQGAIERAVLPGVQGGQFMAAIAAKGWICEYAKDKEYIEYQQQVLRNMEALVVAFREEGISLVSGGSDNHLCILDLTPFGVTGKEVAGHLECQDIIVNQNAIPFDRESPLVTSGIRVGSPFMTALGKKEDDFSAIGKKIAKIIKK